MRKISNQGLGKLHGIFNRFRMDAIGTNCFVVLELIHDYSHTSDGEWKASILSFAQSPQVAFGDIFSFTLLLSSSRFWIKLE